MKLNRVKPDEPPRLDDEAAAPPADLPSPDEMKRHAKEFEDEVSDLQSALYAEGKRSLLVIFQARDAAGKDGAIKKVFGPLNPQGSYTHSFKAPTETELAHDYLWRVHQVVPQRGFIGIFNRSHYEDVLVVRVENLVPEEVWRKRYDQINHFERILAENGTTILKFFLHVSRDEQKQRLIARLDEPSKNWKFNAGDLRAREQWDAYTEAYHDALVKCSTPWAPWYVVPADDKKARDYLVSRKVLQALRKMDPKYPPPEPGVLEWRDKIV
jgi:PPK2 family polyphosphate:nucleotide phosphotransferase